MKGGFFMHQRREEVKVRIDIVGEGKCVIDGGLAETTSSLICKVSKGGTITLKAVADSNNKFVGWMVDGKQRGTATIKKITYVINDPTQFNLLFTSKEDE